MSRATPIAESIYLRLTNEEDARVCREISDEACREVPGNFSLILLTHFITKLGDAVSSPKTVLAWVMTSIQAPVYLLGFLVPIRESGSLIPQLVIASHVRRLPVRKWVWVIGSLLQAVAMMGIGVVVIGLTGASAGWAIIGLLGLFSLARGLCSVASKDVMGKAIPKARRGQLTGWSASAAGLVTVGLGLGILFTDTQLHGGAFYGFLLATAGALWVVAAIIYSLIREFPGETEGGGNALAEAWQRLDILRTDAPFRRFVLTRSLLLSSALVAPYYVALAQQQRGSPVHLLGLFVLAAGLASLLSAPIWGRFADRSSRKVMIAGAVISAVMGIAVFLVVRYLPGLAQSLWFVPVSYFILSIAHDGIRVGRKTYVIDMAQGNRRTDYVAVSNSVIGVVLLAAGLLGTLAAVISLSGVILLFAAVGLVGARLASSLPEVE